MSTFTRWISKTQAEDALNIVAASTLTNRFQAVQHFLNLAATQNGNDVESVHQLRVWTRRTVAAVELYREFLPDRSFRRLQKQLKRIRRAAGKARDLDVLAAESRKSDKDTSKWVQKHLQQQRDNARQPIRRIRKRKHALRRFQHDIDSSLEHVRADNRSTESFDVWGRRQLKPIVRKFLKSARQAQTKDVAVLHRFRIRSKKLRYAMELLAPAFEPEFRTELYPQIEELLERLGEIHDRFVGRNRMRKWKAGARSRKQAKRFQRLAADQNRQLRQSLRDFARWWTPTLITQLESGFERVSQAVPEDHTSACAVSGSA